MKLKGKVDIEKVDIIMYQGIHDIASSKLKRVDGELIPTFIIEEALSYFCELEKYEKCQSIKTFFAKNPSYTIESTREDWYGIGVKKKQKS